MPDEISEPYYIRCMTCLKPVSTPLKESVAVRALIICPDCVEKYGVGALFMKAKDATNPPR